MKSFTAVRLVAARDFRERVTSRAFQLSTAITVLLVVGFLIAPSFFSDKGPPEWTIGTVGDVPAGLVAGIQAAAPTEGTKVDTVSYADPAAAEQALRDGDVDIVITDDRRIITGDGTDQQLITLTAGTATSLTAVDRAAELGVDPAALTELLAGGTYDIQGLAAEDPAEESNRNIALIATIFLFISIVTYGQWILVGVIEEKTNRVVEVVLGTVRPHHLLAGKVLGIGLLGLIQLLLIGTVAIVVANQTNTFDIPPATGGIAVTVVIWFVLGFAFYATGYAAAGSLVSRQEEAQNAAFPLTMLLMAAYFVATFSFTGDNPVLRIFSLLPPFAPMTMPIRMAGGDALAWEVALSLTLMVLATYALVRLAGRVYSGGLLKGGGKVKLREAWRSAEV